MSIFSRKRYDIYEGKRVKNSSEVRNLKISKLVIGIDDYTFQYFKNMGEVIIPNSVEFIGKESFKGCESLLEVKLPDSVFNVGEGAFEYCKNLHSAILSESLGAIPAQMFNGCEVLNYLCVPKSVRSVGKEAFKDCKSMDSIAFEGDIPPNLSDDFTKHIAPNCKIYVYEKVIDTYRAENGWHDIQMHLRPIDKEVIKKFSRK